MIDKKDRQLENVGTGGSGKKYIVKKVFKWIGLGLVVVVIVSVGAVGAMYLKYKPTIDKAQAEAFTKEGQINSNTFKKAGSSVVLDTKGNQIAKVSGNTYQYVESGDISQYVSEGYIAVEDRNFLYEKGISYKGMARAGFEYIKNRGKITSGGSTITQQLIKNVLLTQDRTMARKITEIFLAPQIEKRYSKAQILEFYMNNCYYGEGCYGIESASQHFFSKPASKLTLAEAATLCGLSNNPTMWSPTNNPNDSTTRRNIVLDSMVTQGYISQEECDIAKNEPLVVNIKQAEKIEENYMSSYAVDCAVRELMRQDGFKFKYIFETDEEESEYSKEYSKTYSDFDRVVRSGGYTIHTSLNQDLQAKLQESVDNSLSGFGEVDVASGKYSMQGAAVSIDNKTGYVVAIVGGRGTTDTFNRGFLAFRQPGSVIKPIIDYTPYFDKGYRPLSVIEDGPIQNGPKNDDLIYRGNVTIRYALETSINTIAYKMLSSMKASTGLKYLEKLKYTGLHPEDNNPIISIGGFTEGVSPVEQAGAYFALANKGYYVQPSCVTRIVYLDDEEVYKNNRSGEQVYTQESAYMMTDVMRGVINSENGTGRELGVGDHYVVGKTGTTSDSKDGWFCGYSAYYTTVVWCGNDIPKSVKDLWGSTYPGHIWQDYMIKVHEGLEPKDFDVPSGIVWKNVDNQGNPTSVDTGTQDMFSQPFLDKEEENAKQEKIKAAAAKQADWDAHEPDRQENANRLADEYDMLSYNDRNDLDIVDKAYNNVMLAIGLVDDETVSTKLTNRVKAHHESISKARQLIVDMVAQELADKREQEIQQAKADAEAKAKAKEEANAILVAQRQLELEAEQTAENCVREIEELNGPSLSARIDNAIEKVALVTNKQLYDELTERINKVKENNNIN